MPRFKYKAVGADGRIHKGETEAPSEQSVIQNLQESGSLPIGAWEIKGRNPLQQLFIRVSQWNKTVSRKDVGLFMSELATLLQSGLPLDHALKTMHKLTTRPPMRSAIKSILDAVQGGANLSTAMTDQTGVFSRLQINMIRAGEAGGELPTVIRGLAEYMERMSDLRSSVITTLIYPAILLVMSALSLFVLLAFVVPKFVPLFEDVGQALPFLTQVTFWMAGFLQQTWWLIFPLAAVIVWGVDRLLANPVRRLQLDTRVLELPYLGVLIKNIDTARFTRTLATLVSNGVPLLAAVKLVKEIISNQKLAGIVENTVSSLEQGQGFARELRESGVFPDLAVQLIEVGEESGALDKMLFKVADIYDKEVQSSLKTFLVLLEPILILGLGGLIGLIIISILMAMLGLNDLVI